MKLFRQEIFEEVSKSDLYGMMFTYVWMFDMESDWEYVRNLTQLFESRGATVYYVELEADLRERLERNKTPNRLEHKPKKRDLEWSENDLMETLEKHRLNSFDGEITFENYIKIDNTDMSAAEVAQMIKERFSL